jgi:hypothetical protein
MEETEISLDDNNRAFLLLHSSKKYFIHFMKVKDYTIPPPLSLYSSILLQSWENIVERW